MQKDYVTQAQRINRGSTQRKTLLLTLLDASDTLYSQLPQKALDLKKEMCWIEEDTVIRRGKKEQDDGETKAVARIVTITYIMCNELTIIL
jgi:hypothetical protein